MSYPFLIWLGLLLLLPEHPQIAVIFLGVSRRPAKVEQWTFLRQDEQILHLHAQFFDSNVVDFDMGGFSPPVLDFVLALIRAAAHSRVTPKFISVGPAP
jgi:hypothetical protein